LIQLNLVQNRVLKDRYRKIKLHFVFFKINPEIAVWQEGRDGEGR
jgi:hypothetical protein